MYWLYYLSIWLILSPWCSSVFHPSGNCSLQTHKKTFPTLLESAGKGKELNHLWLVCVLVEFLTQWLHKNKCIQGFYAYRAVSLGCPRCPQIRRQSGSFCDAATPDFFIRRSERLGKVEAVTFLMLLLEAFTFLNPELLLTVLFINPAWHFIRTVPFEATLKV